MGANNVLPTIPSFTAGAPALTDLNNLAYAASFLIDHDVRPAWKFFLHGSTPSITASTWTVVPFTNVVYDSDGVWSSGNTGALIVTQGYYKLEACVQPEIGAATTNFSCAFKWTAGGSSPYSASSPAWFGYRGCNLSLTGSAAASNSGCISAITPVPMYPGDKLQVMVWLTNTLSLEPNDNAGYISGRMSCQFTGRWERSGS